MRKFVKILIMISAAVRKIYTEKYINGDVAKQLKLDYMAECFLLGNSTASEFNMPTFRNTLSVPSS